MIIQCETCEMFFDDEFRSTLCDHDAFPANDGANGFAVHEDAYLAPVPPDEIAEVEDSLSDAEADANAFRGIGWGTNEDLRRQQ